MPPSTTPPAAPAPLLLKASDEAGPRGSTIYGQEMDNATSALARMNMILHDNPTAKIWKGNTLAAPQWKEGNNQLKSFDFAVASPPFSNKNWTSGLDAEHDEFGRFVWAYRRRKWRLRLLAAHHQEPQQPRQGAVILPHGVLFRGNAEARIRENLLKQGFIKGHYRPACQPLLRHRYSGLHHRHRQRDGAPARHPAPAAIAASACFDDRCQ